MKTVAVILINFNGIEDTIECVDSLLRSKTKANIKIIVVDNCSHSDEASKLENLYPDLHVIRSNVNLGTAGGNNLALKYLKDINYDYVLILNNDTVINEDMIDILISADNGKCVCLPKMYYYDSPNTIWYGGGSINRLTGSTKHYRFNHMDDISCERITSCTYGTLACVLISKKVLQLVGHFNEDYFMYCEDSEYSLRLLQNSVEILYVPSAHLWHKVSRSSGGAGSYLSDYYTTRNRFLYLRSYHKYFSLSAFPYSLFSRYVRIVQYAISGNDRWKYIYKGLVDYFKGVRGKVGYFE